MADVEDLRIILRAEVDKAVGKLRNASRQSKQSAKDWSDLNKQFKDQVKQSLDLKRAYGQMTAQVAAGIGVYAAANAAFQAMNRFVGESIQAFKEQEQAVAKLEAVLRATGGAAGLTSQEMQAFASELQSATTYGDEAIINMQGTLATFKSVSGDTFKDATRLALDLSAAFGQDLQSSAMQVGKALEDPVKGVSALQRIGVSFSESQKQVITDLVETGNKAEAQRLILKELEGQVGGVASAMANTATGAMQQYQNVLGDTKEEIGRFIVNGLEPLTRVFTQVAGAIQGVLKEQNDYNAAIRAVQSGTATTDQRLMVLSEERRQLEAMIRSMEAQKGLSEDLGGYSQDQYNFAVAQLQAIKNQHAELERSKSLNAQGAAAAKKRAAEEAAAAEKARLEREALQTYLDRVNEAYSKTSEGRIALLEKEIQEFENYAKTAKNTAPQVAAVLKMLREQLDKLKNPGKEETGADDTTDKVLERLQHLYSRTAEGIAEANAETLSFVQTQRAIAEASGASADELSRFDAILRSITATAETGSFSIFGDDLSRIQAVFDDLNRDLENMLSNVFQGGLVDGFVAIGDAMASGGDAGQAFGQAMRQMGADALRQVSSLALTAGMRILAETGTAGLPIAAGLFAIAGVSAIASGFMGSGGSGGGGTLRSVAYDPVMQAEKELRDERLRLLKEQIKEERKIRQEAIRKLSESFDAEYEVLRDQWERNIISTEQFTAQSGTLRGARDTAIEDANAPTDAEKEVQSVEAAMEAERIAMYQMRQALYARASRAAAAMAQAKPSGGIAGAGLLIFYKKMTNDAINAIPTASSIQQLQGISVALDALSAKLASFGAPAFATGGDFITRGPQMIMVGDNPGGRERVRVDPIGSPNLYGPGSGGVVIQINAPVYGIDDLYEKLERAAQRLEARGRRRGVLV